jgi:hypothetical protein
LIQEKIKADFISRLLVLRAAAEAKEFEKENREYPGEPEAVFFSNNDEVNVIIFARVVHGEGAGDGNEFDGGDKFKPVSGLASQRPL